MWKVNRKWVHAFLFALTICYILLSRKPIQTKPRILVTFVAAGNSFSKLAIIKNNLDGIMRNTEKYNLQVDCQIMAYSKYHELPEWLKDKNSPENQFCPLTVFHRQGYIFFLKTISPFFLNRVKYSHVFIVLDDVALFPPFGNFDLSKFLEVAVNKNAAVATPAIKNSWWRNMRPSKNISVALGRYVDMIEIQATLFHIDAWNCIYELVDTEFPSGWGIDLWFWDYCIKSGRLPAMSMTVIDTYQGWHDPYNEAVVNNHSRELMNAQEKHWMKTRNIKLKQTYMHNLGLFA
jgi:hypothetical protein